MKREPNILEDGTTCFYCRKTGIPLQKYHWLAYWICDSCRAQEPARIAQENARMARERSRREREGTLQIYTVYQIANDRNNKSYVGLTRKTDIRERLWDHQRKARAGEMRPLYIAMRAIGFEHFSIVPLDTFKEKPKNEYLAEDRELQWIHRLGSLAPNGYNDPAHGVLTLEMAAIIRYDFYDWRKEDYWGADKRYADHFGVSRQIIKNVQNRRSSPHASREHLPKERLVGQLTRGFDED